MRDSRSRFLGIVYELRWFIGNGRITDSLIPVAHLMRLSVKKICLLQSLMFSRGEITLHGFANCLILQLQSGLYF